MSCFLFTCAKLKEHKPDLAMHAVLIQLSKQSVDVQIKLAAFDREAPCLDSGILPAGPRGS